MENREDQESRTTGSRQKKGGLLPLSTVLTGLPLTTQSPNTRTIGDQSQGNEQPRPIGKKSGTIVSVKSLPGGVKLAEQSPPLVDRWIKGQLPPRVASLIATAEILDPDYNIIGYGPIALTEAESLQVREILAPMCVPMDFEEVVKRLTRARSLTKRRADKGDDEEMTLDAYAELFMDYPADVSALVLTKLHRLDAGWWPAGARVEKELAWYGKGRVELWKAINQ